MRNIITTFLLSAILFLGACSEYKKGSGTLEYKIVKDANTPAVAKLAVVFLSYTEATESGKVLSATGQFDPRPSEVYATMPKFKGDLQDAFQYLSEGDSAVVKVSMDSLKNGGYINSLPKDHSKFIIYTLKLHKVINQEGKEDTSFLQRVEAYKKSELVKYKADEGKRIKNYLSAKKMHYKVSPSGLIYPTELKVVNNNGKKLYVQYSISSLDGKTYQAGFREVILPAQNFSKDTNLQPLVAKPGEEHFPGFMEAVSMIPKGVKTKMIIPSSLAYGAKGNNTDMPPYTALVCEMELLNK